MQVQLQNETEGELVKALIERVSRQEKQIKELYQRRQENCRKIGYNMYEPFLQQSRDKKSAKLIILKVPNTVLEQKRPIYVSNNLEFMPLRGIVQMNDVTVQTEYRWEAAHLAEEVQQMKHNLKDYAELINSRKELMELKHMEREQDSLYQSIPTLKYRIEALSTQNNSLKEQLEVKASQVAGLTQHIQYLNNNPPQPPATVSQLVAPQVVRSQLAPLGHSGIRKRGKVTRFMMGYD